MYTHRKQQEQGEGVTVPQITQKLKLTFPLLSVSLVGVSLMEYFGCAILGHSIYVGLTAGMIQIFFSSSVSDMPRDYFDMLYFTLACFRSSYT